MLLTLLARLDIFNQMWVMANPDSFLANNEVLIAYNNGVRSMPSLQNNHAHADRKTDVHDPNRIDRFDETANRYYTYDDDAH